MGQTVHKLVQEFAQDPFSISRTLREMREANPLEFEAAAFRSLAELEEGPGTRLLITLLHEEESLLRRIVDPMLLDLPSAVRLVNALRHTDAQTEVRLIRMIMPGADPVPEAVTNRVLDLIDAVTDSPKLVPVLMHLYRAAPKKIRARLATTIGRHHRNRDWVEERLRDEDPRVRANMVEVFWGESSTEALEIFRAALHDTDARVLGNAAVGLYRAGSVDALAFLGKKMAVSESFNDRASAAWAMGSTHDPRFQKTLAGFVKDPDPLVRRNAFRSLGEIKRSQDLRKDRAQCQLRFIKLRRASEGLLHILFEIKDTKSQVALRGIKPLEVLVSENGMPVFEYQLVERLKYPQPGIYDLHFRSEHALDELPAGVTTRMLKVELVVSTEKHLGEHSSYWFGE